MRTIILLILLVLAGVPCLGADFGLTIAVDAVFPEPGEDNVHIRFLVPEGTQYDGSYRLVIYLKGPWGIDVGGVSEYCSPACCTGKKVLADDRVDLPWWGDAQDPNWHRDIVFNTRLELKKLPWETVTLNVVAYRTYNGIDWEQVAVKTVKLRTGHRHRIVYKGQTVTEWYQDPDRTLIELTVYLVTAYTTGRSIEQLFISKAAYKSWLCPAMKKKLWLFIEKELLKWGASTANKRLAFKIFGDYQFQMLRRTYTDCCYHYDEPHQIWWDSDGDGDEEYAPLAWRYVAELTKERVLLTFKKGTTEKEIPYMFGFVREETIFGQIYSEPDLIDRGCVAADPKSLPTVMWTDKAKNQRGLWHKIVNHTGDRAYNLPCVCKPSHPEWREGF